MKNLLFTSLLSLSFCFPCSAQEKTPFDSNLKPTPAANAEDDLMRDYIANSVQSNGGKDAIPLIWRSRRFRAVALPSDTTSLLTHVAASTSTSEILLDLISVQNARLIEQNDKIIALLTAIAAKK